MIPVSVVLDELEEHVVEMEKHAIAKRLPTLDMEGHIAWGIGCTLSRFIAIYKGKLSDDDQQRFDVLEARRKAAAAALYDPNNF